MAQVKTWAEIAVMPLVVALVGIYGSSSITNQQRISAEELSNAQLTSTRELAVADRQLKMLEIFSEKVSSPNVSERMLALRLLRAMDGELAEKLSSAVAEGEPARSDIRVLAEAVARDATARSRARPRIFIHTRDEADRARARAIGDRLAARGYSIPEAERIRSGGPKNSQLRYFQKGNESEARAIAASLDSMGVKVQVTYMDGYERSLAIGPRHYEVWLSTGRPGP